MTLAATARRGARGLRRRVRRVRAAINSHGRRRALARRGALGAEVDIFAARELAGWVSTRVDAPPVRVALFLNDFEVAATWAVPDGPTVTGAQRRVFRLPIMEIWQFSSKASHLTVRAHGVPIQIKGRGLSFRPANSGTRTANELKQLLADGHVFDHSGRLQLSKSRDIEWQRAVMGLYERIQVILKDTFGYDMFFCYGTLLGAVRENGFIRHDNDFDAAYISESSEASTAANELKDIALHLIDVGFDVECKRTALHIHDEASPQIRVDLFHLYFDHTGRLALPFGTAGTTEITKEQWRGVHEIEFAHGRGHLPVIAEELAEKIYGRNWRVPQPGFSWAQDRTTTAPEGSMVPIHDLTDVFWENFYRRQDLVEPTPFFTYLSTLADSAPLVVDLGCGTGRDTLAFASAGRRVLGLDRSRYGLAAAARHAARLPEGVGAEFRRCDFRDEASLGAELDAVVSDAGSENVLYYGRFLLHAIEESTQELLLTAIRHRIRPGDQCALELRTHGPDSEQVWTHGRHYRRLQDGAALVAQLQNEQFTIVDVQEGTGLSPYLGEDPQLLRVVARFDPRQT